MKLSEVIAQLQAAKDKFGDLPTRLSIDHQDELVNHLDIVRKLDGESVVLVVNTDYI